MKYFDEFVSNTLAGSSTQSFFNADEKFNNNPILADGRRAVYGSHPDAVDCGKWAEALYPTIKEFISGK